MFGLLQRKNNIEFLRLIEVLEAVKFFLCPRIMLLSSSNDFIYPDLILTKSKVKNRTSITEWLFVLFNMFDNYIAQFRY